jgi:ankyrin repeat protein
MMKILNKLTASTDNQVVHIRGFARPVEDLNDMDALQDIKNGAAELEAGNPDLKDTVMWNPLHFAVYNGHLQILQ